MDVTQTVEDTRVENVHVVVLRSGYSVYAVYVGQSEKMKTALNRVYYSLNMVMNRFGRKRPGFNSKLVEQVNFQSFKDTARKLRKKGKMIGLREANAKKYYGELITKMNGG